MSRIPVTGRLNIKKDFNIGSLIQQTLFLNTKHVKHCPRKRTFRKIII
jgi:hypothetical protein